MTHNSMRTRKKNQPGAVLITALAVMVMLTILLTSAISFVSTNQTTTLDNYKEEQAYLTAYTTLQSFVTQIQMDTQPGNANAATNISNLKVLALDNSGAGSTTNVKYNGFDTDNNNLGTCTMKVVAETPDASSIKIECTSNYLGKAQTVVAHIQTASKTHKADFTNAIELLGTGTVSYDNLNVVGDFAALDNTDNMKIISLNNTSVYGKTSLHGSFKNTTGTKLILEPSIADPTIGSYVSISGELTTVNNALTIKSTKQYPGNIGEGSDRYNYVNIGSKLISDGGKFLIGEDGSLSTDPDKAIDIFCSEIDLGGSDTIIYGNLYCYKKVVAGIVQPGYTGNATISTNNAKIYGDVYIEGDLNVTATNPALQITGNLYVGGTITDPNNRVTVTGIKNAGATSEIASAKGSARGTRPVDDLISDDYISYPEQFLMSTDPAITIPDVATKYKAFYSSGGVDPVNTKTLIGDTDKLQVSDVTDAEVAAYNVWATANGQPTITTKDEYINKTNTTIFPGNIGYTADGVDGNYRFHITESCTLTTHGYDSASGTYKQRSDYSKFNNSIINGVKILVDVSDVSGDIVLRMPKDGSFLQKNVTYVIRNTSTYNSTTKNYKYNCYFVSDSGTDITLGAKDSNGKYTYTYVGGADTSTVYEGANKTTNSDFSVYNCEKLKVLEYNIYKEICPDDKLINPESDWQTDSTYGIQPSALSNTCVIFVLAEDTVFKATNNSLFQGTFYAPKANVSLATEGQKLTIKNSAGDVVKDDTDLVLKVNLIGVVICENFQSANKTFYVYQKPSETSLLSFAKAPKTDAAVGYAVKKYDYT